MTKTRILLWVLLLTLRMGSGSHAHDSTPKFDRIDHDFTAVCQVGMHTFGRRTAVMTKSTGVKSLDDYIMAFAGNASPNPGIDMVSVRVTCGIVKVNTSHGPSEVTVAMPFPPYPYQARTTRAQGSTKIQVSFDKNGRVASAVVTQSSGSKTLDSHTVNYVLNRWRSSGGEKVTIVSSIDYQFK